MAVTLEQWYRQMPVVTRSYLTLSFLTTAGCALELISPFSVYYNSHLIFRKYQLWRLFTNFFFFGSLGMDFVFHMFFLSRYCRLLEEGTFRGRSADFFYMLLFGSALLSSVAPFINIQFLGASLTFMMVYVWGRRNRYVQMSFLGLFSFTAPYLPWVLLIFSCMLGSSPVVDLLGMAAGHVYYFLEDVYPTMTNRRVLKTPALVRYASGLGLPFPLPFASLLFRAASPAFSSLFGVWQPPSLAKGWAPVGFPQQGEHAPIVAFVGFFFTVCV